MKKVCFYIASLTLIACGETSSNEVSVNDPNQPSSVVQTTDVEIGETTGNSETGHSTETNVSGNLTTIEYIETKHNFGDVFYPSDNMYTFKFKNTGKFPLIIEDATASCGCTVPNKPEEPIAPGEIGELDVLFRPKEGQVGQVVTKTITVVANTQPAETYLEISANVKAGMGI